MPRDPDEPPCIPLREDPEEETAERRSRAARPEQGEHRADEIGQADRDELERRSHFGGVYAKRTACIPSTRVSCRWSRGYFAGTRAGLMCRWTVHAPCSGVSGSSSVRD